MIREMSMVGLGMCEELSRGFQRPTQRSVEKPVLHFSSSAEQQTVCGRLSSPNSLGVRESSGGDSPIEKAG